MDVRKDLNLRKEEKLCSLTKHCILTYLIQILSKRNLNFGLINLNFAKVQEKKIITTSNLEERQVCVRSNMERLGSTLLDGNSDKTVTILDLTTKHNATRDSFQEHTKRFPFIVASSVSDTRVVI